MRRSAGGVAPGLPCCSLEVALMLEHTAYVQSSAFALMLTAYVSMVGETMGQQGRFPTVIPPLRSGDGRGQPGIAGERS